MRTDELDFHLPPDLIAQAPTPDRAASRLLHYKRAGRSVEHRHFSDLPGLLTPGDLLVFNDARVLQARFMLRKETGGLIEGLFVSADRPAIAGASCSRALGLTAPGRFGSSFCPI